jgi:phage terminase large subunit-like protein
MPRLTPDQREATRRWTRTPADRLAVKHGCWFDEETAEYVCTFFETQLRHSKGEWAGQAFLLLPWQRDEVIMPLFGWMRRDGTRRYRTAYIEVPKKSGKSTMASGVALFMLLMDGEAGSEVYSAAATRDQAAIVYREASNMVQASPSLNKRLTRVDSLKHMADDKTKSWYKALSADAGANEGLNIHCLIMDEMHAQKNDKFWHALMYGGAARRQFLQVILTTAGVDQDSLCYEYHTKAMQIQEGLIQDDSFFAYVRSAEWAMRRAPEAERDLCWREETVWYEANPSLGHTISLASFREDFARAVNSPRLENAFKRYRLIIWTQQEERWLPMDHWAACGEDYRAEDLAGGRCFAGLDLASSSDFCALVLWFPESTRLLSFFWLPEVTVEERERAGDGFYPVWVRQGFLKTTACDITDYTVIEDDIEHLLQSYRLVRLGFDPYNSNALINALQALGLECIAFSPTFRSLSPPAKEFEQRIIAHELHHNRHAVLTWCVGNAAVARHREGAIMPSNRQSKKKIDGVTASVIAIGAWLLDPEAGRGSVYESRGVIVI